MSLHGKKSAIAGGRGVIAVLGPTNTGKTHLAIERMAAHQSGVIGLPLRLLAREVYQRMCTKAGVDQVALITGEERIEPANARFQVCTVEAMPISCDAAFVAIDEVQLAADLERGHVFTDRLLNLRGTQETMLLGAETAKPVLQALLPGLNVVTRPRMSMLTYTGSKKITRLPRRSAIVAFNADEVYAIAELIRRQRGGAAVVLGSLSPRTRNAQVELFLSGDVDFIVATDAIGMGLNLAIDHVAFAQERKFDGFQTRTLTAAEFGQIAGRAGRHTADGTFGITAGVGPLDDILVRALETHNFDPIKVLSWRNRNLDRSSIAALSRSLDQPSDHRLLSRTPPASDQRALGMLAGKEQVRAACGGKLETTLLWECCQLPDYRKIAPAEHAGLVENVFLQIAEHGRVSQSWFEEQIGRVDRYDGDIDALSSRIAHVRTWTYLSNRGQWFDNPLEWQSRIAKIEDRLSDALHERLTKRFVDRRTSVLMRRLRENAMLEAEISATGDVIVEEHVVGRLVGFRFTPDAAARGPEAKAANAAAMKALAAEMERRAARLAAGADKDFAIDFSGMVRWLGEPVAQLAAGETAITPRLVLMAGEQLTGAPLDKVEARLTRWLRNRIGEIAKSLIDLNDDKELTGVARGVAFRIVENLGVVERRDIAAELRELDQDTRRHLRKHGIRFGAYHVYTPALLKPAAAELLCQLWRLQNPDGEAAGIDEIPKVLAAGRTSMAVDPAHHREIYRLCGFRILGDKAVRVDILERLADLVRPALAWRPASGAPRPDGAVDGYGFVATPAMLSILGATHEDMSVILKALGYRGEPRPADQLSEFVMQSATPKPAAPDAEATVAAKAPEPASVAAGEPDDKPDAIAQADRLKDAAEIVLAAVAPQDSQEAEVAAGDATVACVADEAPKTVMLWRPARSERRPAGNRGPRKPGSSAKGKSTETRPQKAKGNRRGQANSTAGTGNKVRRKPAKPERPVDPDSPFAKLAALKESLKTGDGK